MADREREPRRIAGTWTVRAMRVDPVGTRVPVGALEV